MRLSAVVILSFKSMVAFADDNFIPGKHSASAFRGTKTCKQIQLRDFQTTSSNSSSIVAKWHHPHASGKIRIKIENGELTGQFTGIEDVEPTSARLTKVGSDLKVAFPVRTWTEDVNCKIEFTLEDVFAQKDPESSVSTSDDERRSSAQTEEAISKLQEKLKKAITEIEVLKNENAAVLEKQTHLLGLQEVFQRQTEDINKEMELLSSTKAQLVAENSGLIEVETKLRKELEAIRQENSNLGNAQIVLAQKNSELELIQRTLQIQLREKERKFTMLLQENERLRNSSDDQAESGSSLSSKADSSSSELNSKAVSGFKFQDALNAFDKNDYGRAFEILKPLAEQGDSNAQGSLGVLYRYGLGVTQDDNKAVKWFRLSAEQGQAVYQHTLGMMYFSGQGITQDYKEAVNWLSLAAAQGVEDSKKTLEEIDRLTNHSTKVESAKSVSNSSGKESKKESTQPVVKKPEIEEGLYFESDLIYLTELQKPITKKKIGMAIGKQITFGNLYVWSYDDDEWLSGGNLYLMNDDSLGGGVTCAISPSEGDKFMSNPKRIDVRVVGIIKSFSDRAGIRLDPCAITPK